MLDASAILAFLQGEEGSEVAEAALGGDSCCGAANWSEVAQKMLSARRDWEMVRLLLDSYGLRVEVVTASDAEWAARRWRPGEGLAPADRLCLALGDRLGVSVLTADK